MKVKVLLGIFLLLILIQLIQIDKEIPSYDPELSLAGLNEIPKNIEALLSNACYDCHSFNTKYPWYSNVAPVSWWLSSHIKNGRAAMNLSQWGLYTEEEKTERKNSIEEYVGKRWMPIGSYRLGHPEARLTDEQRDLIINYFKSVK